MKNEIVENIENVSGFPLCKTKKITGKRRNIREKVLQLLMSYENSDIQLELIFNHVFFREFNFGDEIETESVDSPLKILTPDEVFELESDIRIVWPKEELNFAKLLFQTVLSQKEKCEDIIMESSRNWKYERIATVDKKIMSIALCELLFFPEIPPKVTINEAIDLGKRFSTEKSGTFINGILDNAINTLKSKNLINKSGKGLN